MGSRTGHRNKTVDYGIDIYQYLYALMVFWLRVLREEPLTKKWLGDDSEAEILISTRRGLHLLTLVVK